MRTVLAVAAESFEFAGISKRASREQRLKWGLAFSRVVELNNMRLILAANGPGPKLAGIATDIAMSRVPVDAVLSTGICGGLDPELAVGDVVVASEVNGFPSLQPATQRPFRGGKAISVNRVALRPEEKSKLRELGASIVEMEAAAVSERARQFAKPFYCVRSISDAANDAFQLDLNAARDSDGRFRRGTIIIQALLHPKALIPEVMRLKRNSDLAAEALGEFVATCCF